MPQLSLAKGQKVKNFTWQRGCGCFSFEQSQSARLIRYIENPGTREKPFDEH
jgi:hypothetical protein